MSDKDVSIISEIGNKIAMFCGASFTMSMIGIEFPYNIVAGASFIAGILAARCLDEDRNRKPTT